MVRIGGTVGIRQVDATGKGDRSPHPRGSRIIKVVVVHAHATSDAGLAVAVGIVSEAEAGAQPTYTPLVPEPTRRGPEIAVVECSGWHVRPGGGLLTWCEDHLFTLPTFPVLHRFVTGPKDGRELAIHTPGVLREKHP